ncbi:hypothetical protein ACV07N_02715 [Roseivirga echinicomitans]
MTKRVALMLFPVVGLALGLLTGWLRMGWDIPMYGMAGFHGVLMVGGFLGSLICFENAVAVKRPWAYLAPILSGLSVFAFILNEASLGYLLQIAASLMLVIIHVVLVNSTKGYDILLPLIGAMCWLAGNVLLYQTQFYPTVFPWWIAFILFTIVGESLKLSSFLKVPKKYKYLLYVLVLSILVGFMMPFHGIGQTVVAYGIIGVAIWLLSFDMARVLLKRTGHDLYTGVTLTLGYVWLLVSALFMIFVDNGAFALDALLHSFFLGFTISVVFGHGPLVFPTLLGKTGHRFHKLLWLWLGIFQLSVITRITADLLTMPLLRKWAGMVNGVIILFFLITMFVLVKKGRTLLPK